MKATLYTLIAAVLFGFPTLARAEQWTGYTKITRLYPVSENEFLFNTEYANSNLSTCEGGTRFRVGGDHPNYETMVRSLQATFLTGKSVTLHVKYDIGSCAATIDRFTVKR